MFDDSVAMLDGEFKKIEIKAKKRKEKKRRGGSANLPFNPNTD